MKMTTATDAEDVAHLGLSPSPSIPLLLIYSKEMNQTVRVLITSNRRVGMATAALYVTWEIPHMTGTSPLIT